MELLDRRGIRRECIRVGSPKHNGVVERHIAMMLDGFLPKSSPPVRRREVTVDGTPLGRGVQVHVRRAEHDVEGSGQAGHALAVPEVPRQSAVCAAAPISEAGLPPRKKDSEVGA